ncbi:hypothetical protein IDM40_24585 [Nocardiopsis sp. HNM0947]|uniref:Uncharacterized protein n=1 Tax=Nocardiopsis coralli TaxID=2772213 RepID=A0ABR9PDF1_9ACTN|nr:hypothetical protein [Nocardiopsis coralli]MBE3001847.1 hypothetical protein [Nocardiopsis coralli]
MSPVPTLVCALLLCGAPPHATGPTEPGSQPRAAALVPADGGPDPGTVPVSDEYGSDRGRPPPTGEPEPDPSPSVPRSAASPTPGTASESPREATPVVRHVASPEPAATASGALGRVSTGLLAVLALLVLGLRLSVGWPRFPEPYLGRRRRPSARRFG